MTDYLALNPGEALPGEIKRLTFDLIDRALEHMGVLEETPDLAVHETRKRLKELRAVVRIVRAEIGERGYRIENFRLRDAGRLLSPARDSAALPATLGEIREKNPDTFIGLHDRDPFQIVLEEVYGVEMEREALREIMRKVEKNLGALSRQVAMWPIHRTDFRSIRKGLRRVYREGREAMLAAREDPTDRNLHEWRKQVKYLWYHARMLALAWPPVLNGLAESLHQLSDALGTDHDLAVLTGTYRRIFPQESGRDDAELMSIIEERRRELQRTAWSVGTLIYTEEPKPFADRIGTYWRAATQRRGE